MFASQILLAAEKNNAPGGFNPLLLIAIVMVAFLVFTMFRNRKRMAKTQQERATKLIPGAEVMTTAGIFGTVVDTFQDQNKVLIEVSPGNRVMFHTQAIAQFVDETASTESPETENNGDTDTDGTDETK